MWRVYIERMVEGGTNSQRSNIMRVMSKIRHSFLEEYWCLLAIQGRCACTLICLVGLSSILSILRISACSKKSQTPHDSYA